MRTSKEIYDHIHWDDGYDERWFTVGYHDRERGIIEVPLSSFVPDRDIPWHRVQLFRYGSILVWNRATGLDLVASVRSRHGSRDDFTETPRPCRATECAVRHDTGFLTVC